MVNFPVDIIDIVIVTFIVYKIITLAKTPTTSRLVKAIFILLLVYYLSSLLGLNVLNFLISKTIEIGLIALVIVFQPELRRLMETLGGSSIKELFFPEVQNEDITDVISNVAVACGDLSQQKVGVLIVFERENSLDAYFKTGTTLDATVSEQLLKNIFFPKAALHDGAVVIRNQRIICAGCVMPLSENPNLSKELGTRHRAAIGVSERTDAIAVVVSEETGTISCAMHGELVRNLTPVTLEQFLLSELKTEEKKPVHHMIRDRLVGIMIKSEVKDDEEE